MVCQAWLFNDIHYKNRTAHVSTPGHLVGAAFNQRDKKKTSSVAVEGKDCVFELHADSNRSGRKNRMVRFRSHAQ